MSHLWSEFFIFYIRTSIFLSILPENGSHSSVYPIIYYVRIAFLILIIQIFINDEKVKPIKFIQESTRVNMDLQDRSAEDKIESYWSSLH